MSYHNITKTRLLGLFVLSLIFLTLVSAQPYDREIDVSGISYFLPVFGFLLVFVVVYALLKKTQILGESEFANVMVGFVVAIIFVTMTAARRYVEVATPWVMVLFIVLLFILILVGMVHKDKIGEIMKNWVLWVFVVAVILIFLIAAIKVFPGTVDSWIYDLKYYFGIEDRVLGSVLLLIIAIIVAVVLTRKAGK